MVPGTPEYEEIRIRIYAELRKGYQDVFASSGGDRSNILQADFSSFYVLLVVVPEETDSYETVNILNYFGFPFNSEEDNILKPAVKKEMGFRKEDEVIIKC